MRDDGQGQGRAAEGLQLLRCGGRRSWVVWGWMDGWMDGGSSQTCVCVCARKRKSCESGVIKCGELDGEM